MELETLLVLQLNIGNRYFARYIDVQIEMELFDTLILFRSKSDQANADHLTIRNRNNSQICQVNEMPQLLLYSPLHKWKSGDYPVHPFVHLSVVYNVEKDGQLLLSPQLMTDREIDETVDGLVQELEVFRRSAKKELKVIIGRQLKE